MQKIASNGATVGLEFTEGNASLNIPATVVSADWLNSVQREMVNFILLLAGAVPLTPITDTWDQLANAVKEFFLRGGRLVPIAQVVANNQASAADITAFPTFDKTLVRGFEFLYYSFRRTDSSHVIEQGRAHGTYNPETNSWAINKIASQGPDGVEFSIVLVSGNEYKLQYTSDNIAGSSYSGELKITDLKQIRI